MAFRSRPMEDDPLKGHAALRRGRFSAVGATYFVTVSTDHHHVGLTRTGTATAIHSEAKNLDTDMSWKLRCMTVMPDHVHLLVTLGDRLTLGKAIARLKSKTCGELQSAKIKWERGFYDRRLRAEDSLAAVLRYVYMNPHRTDPPLIHAGINNAPWPWFYCADKEWDIVRDTLNDDPSTYAWTDRM